MIDSYLAPTDLAEARSRRDADVAARCKAAGVDQEEPGAVVHLERGPVEPQAASIAGATVCVADFVLWRLEPADLAVLAGALRPDAWLAFVEPTADTGWRQAVHRYGRALWLLGLRHDFEQDLPAQLRAAGMVLVTMDRFGLGPGEIRSYVRGEARLRKAPT